jgi:hypothetical protein
MEYVYMQQPKPTNATGVPVSLNVIDSNGNFREIGSTTTDIDGFFTYNWTPDVPGQYVVYAMFDGSESYWPSHAVTSFAVDSPPQTSPTQQAVIVEQPTEMYFALSTAAIIIAIAIVGAVLLLAVKKRA